MSQALSLMNKLMSNQIENLRNLILHVPEIYVNKLFISLLISLFL